MPDATPEYYLHETAWINSPEDWGKVRDLCDGFLDVERCTAFHDYFNGDVKTVVVEREYVDKDYRSAFSNFHSKKFARYSDRTSRLHFFSARLPKEDIFSLDKHQGDYIGFSVIRPTLINPIGRTVLDPRKITKVKGNMPLATYQAHVLGAELEVSGFPYMSQDSDLTVCAHAACWMVFRYMSERYTQYAEALPFDIARMTEDLSGGRLTPSNGLYISQVAEIFFRFGLFPVVYNRADNASEFEKLLYYYIESGLPVVASLSEKGHAITVFGHVSDYNRNPKYGDSFDFLDSFVVNDDNHLPYQRPSRETSGDVAMEHRSRHCIADVDGFVVGLYEKIYLAAEDAVEHVSKLLKDERFGLGLKLMDGLVKRLYLTSSKSYKKHLFKRSLPAHLSSTYAEMGMPKFIWVCELSTAGLYRQRRIFGEIVLDATATKWDEFSFLAIHYPDRVIFNDRNCAVDVPEKFYGRRFAFTDLPSYPMYINNLTEVK
ncbi:MAG: hypothetical protein HY894_03135 [Deltaproteobacteria bacterium]|nr:hypothetical protein [Deltaproteobacteria bacterium]